MDRNSTINLNCFGRHLVTAFLFFFLTLTPTIVFSEMVDDDDIEAQSEEEKPLPNPNSTTPFWQHNWKIKKDGEPQKHPTFIYKSADVSSVYRICYFPDSRNLNWSSWVHVGYSSPGETGKAVVHSRHCVDVAGKKIWVFYEGIKPCKPHSEGETCSASGPYIYLGTQK